MTLFARHDAHTHAFFTPAGIDYYFEGADGGKFVHVPPVMMGELCTTVPLSDACKDATCFHRVLFPPSLALSFSLSMSLSLSFSLSLSRSLAHSLSRSLALSLASSLSLSLRVCAKRLSETHERVMM
jgi:hypothetical protein